MKFGEIIILNGTSSAGKTSILIELQKIMNPPYLNAGFDKFIWMLPHRCLKRPLWYEVMGHANKAGQIGHQLASGMHHAIVALAKAGNNVIADHVLVEQQWLDECVNLFSDLHAFFIGVKCPLEVVQQRERDRKNRTIGIAKAQYDLVHRHNIYDFEVDTSIATPEECAWKIKKRVEEGSPPNAFKRIKQLQE